MEKESEKACIYMYRKWIYILIMDIYHYDYGYREWIYIYIDINIYIDRLRQSL